jgi:predicted amino acid dehydrogenase
MRVAFCGHAYISQPDTVKQWLCDAVACLISEGAEVFYLGGY